MNSIDQSEINFSGIFTYFLNRIVQIFIIFTLLALIFFIRENLIQRDNYSYKANVDLTWMPFNKISKLLQYHGTLNSDDLKFLRIFQNTVSDENIIIKL